MVLDDMGKRVRLFEQKHIPHMLKHGNKVVAMMPRAHPGIQVQVEVIKNMYLSAAS